MEKDLILEIHEWGRRKVLNGEGIDQGELIKHLQSKNFDLQQGGVEYRMFVNAWNQTFGYEYGTGNYFKNESYFNYLDHLEYKAALESSRNAKRLAFWSLAIAIGTGIGQIWASIHPESLKSLLFLK
ncbi:MAG: hypothetical protein RI911_204 [Candidatus Parcubacteria bacterium]|jgi:hypothetical protein